MFRYPNGTVESVPQVGGMLAYYLLFGNNVKAFPAGFQMLSGDSTRRNFTLPFPDPPKSLWTVSDLSQTALAQKALGFNCLNYGDKPEPSLYRHSLPERGFIDSQCADGLRLEVAFPSCWNGKDMDSPNHKSHVAYSSLIFDGSCPTGFNVRVPTIFFETIFWTPKFKGVAGAFVLSNGDETGKAQPEPTFEYLSFTNYYSSRQRLSWRLHGWLGSKFSPKRDQHVHKSKRHD